MRDDKTRLALQDTVERRLDEKFGLRIDGAGRLVQNDDARIFEDDARKGQKLFFACGKSFAALAEHGVVAVREPLRDAVAIDRLCRGDALFVRRFGRAVADIVEHRPFEDEGLLHQDADLLPEGVQRRVAHVDAVHHDAALVDVVKAGQEADDRRLSRARGTDERDLLARADVQVEVFEHVDAGFIAERDVIEIYLPFHIVKRDGVLLIMDGDGRIDGLVYALQICRDLRELLQDRRKREQRLGAERSVEREGDDRTRKRRSAAQDEVKGYGVNGEDADVPEEFGDGRVELVAAHDLHPRLGAVLLQTAVDFAVIVGAVVVLDDLLAHDGLDDEGVAVGVLCAVISPQAAHGALDEIHAHRERHRRRVDDRRKERAQAEHKDGRHDDLQNVHDEVEQIIGEEVGKLVDVIGDADGDLSRGAVVVVVEGKLLQFYKDLAAHFGDDPVPERPHDALMEVRQHRGEHAQHAQRHKVDDELRRALVAVGQDVVDDGADDERREHRRDRRERQKEQREQEELFIGYEAGEQTAEILDIHLLARDDLVHVVGIAFHIIPPPRRRTSRPADRRSSAVSRWRQTRRPLR